MKFYRIPVSHKLIETLKIQIRLNCNFSIINPNVFKKYLNNITWPVKYVLFFFFKSNATSLVLEIDHRRPKYSRLKAGIKAIIRHIYMFFFFVRSDTFTIIILQ